VKEEYEFWNAQNGTLIITTEMVDFSAMKSYLEKNNLYYPAFSNSEKPTKAVISHLPSDMLAQDISNSLRGLRLQCHQREANDSHLKSTQQTSPCENPPSIPCYLNKEHKTSRNIQA
jgi:hypothetical protein